MSIQDKIKSILDSEKIDAMLITDEYNMRYLSGAEYEGLFFGLKDRGFILTDSRYTEVATKQSRGFEVIELKTSYTDIIKEFINKFNIKTIGFEDKNMTYSVYKNYSSLGAEFRELGDNVDRLRVIKSEQELEYLKMAESIGDKAFDYILGIIKPGMTEIEIAIELENAMKRNGAEKTSFDSIVASGINGSMPHAVPGRKKVEIGELITMDFGCKYNGYCSDMTRTIMLGKANDKQKEIYNVVLEAQLAALDALHAGVIGCEVDKVARDIIAKAGYGNYFGHGLGHSVGLFIHEFPSLSPKSNTPIEENVIVTVEPGIYIPNFGGVRIEDMVVVTKDGHINFAKSRKELIEL